MFPSVNGLDNQQHIVLDVNRTGTLNCSMDRVLPNVELELNYINHSSSNSIALDSQRYYSIDNGDGTHNIMTFANYNATDDSVECATLKCMVSGKESERYPLFTTVELHLPAAGK